MSALDAACFALWTVLPVYVAACRAQQRPRPRPLPRPVLPLLVLGAAVWVGRRDSPAVGVATAIAAVTAVASVLVLLVAARPRLARLMALLAPCVAALLTARAGGCHVP